MRHQKLTSRILCSNRVDANVRRYAVEVKRGREIERVAIIDVAGPIDRPMDLAKMAEAAQQRAMYPNLGTMPLGAQTKIVGAAYDDGRFTGVEQPAEARS